MKTNIFTLFLLLAIPFAGSAQVGNFCAADAFRQKLIQEHPEVLQDEAELEAFTKEFEANFSHYEISRAGNIVLPIVFHIIHQGGSENLSDARIRDQIKTLNEDYNKLNPDQSTVIPWFQPRIGNIGVEFRLANIDPSGNPTNGIERINSCQTYVGNDYSKMHNWPRDKYINVWVYRQMRDGAAGYAYYPGSVQAIYATPARDGINILSDYVGGHDGPSYNLYRALTHEIGHFLNLKHVWGDTNEPTVACGDDDVNDTPITKGYMNCPSANASKICNADSFENYQNYMDYSYCSRMFSNGQGVRMIAALNSNKADRNNLWSAANLAATGIEDTFYTPSAPVADFSVSKRYVCLNGSVTLLDGSWNGTVDSYYWEIPNGNPAISTDKNPVVQFLVAGWQPVTLTVTNATGTSTKTNNALVYVANDLASYQAPFFQGFEDNNVFGSNEWVTANYDWNLNEFKQVDYTSHSGSKSAQLNNYYAHTDRDIDEIVSPGFDLSGLTTTAQRTLSFYYSWASTSTDFSDFFADSMEVYATVNCGSTWNSIYKKGTHNGSAALINAGSVPGFFTPTTAEAYWKFVKINLPIAYQNPNVRFKFRVYSSVGGNNFYIDDINIGGATTGIEDMSVVNGATIFPNPTEGNATLSLSLASAGKVSVNVIDITGKVVLSVFEGKLNDGESQLPINGSSLLAAGVYVVNVKAGDSVVQRKLVIK